MRTKITIVLVAAGLMLSAQRKPVASPPGLSGTARHGRINENNRARVPDFGAAYSATDGANSGNRPGDGYVSGCGKWDTSGVYSVCLALAEGENSIVTPP